MQNFSLDHPKVSYDKWLIKQWFTEENAGSQQAYVQGAEQQIAACSWQEERHTQNLDSIAGIGPTTHNQE